MLYTMDAQQQELLERMIQENDTKDNTGLIRELAHSAKIRRDVSVIQNIKRRSRSTQFSVLDKEAQAQKCGFLFKHYPNIYNKLLRGEIQIKVLYRFLDELESVERGEQSQQEASYKIGMLLKEMYVDKRIDLDKEKEGEKAKAKMKSGKKISYEEFKRHQGGMS